jgi:hypothetical protein
MTMADSYTITQTTTFTITHAKHMAAKVATDLKRMQRLYGKPSDIDIASYESEVVELLREGYLETITYGFRRNGNWIEPLRYTARDLAGSSTNDDDPGRIRPGANTDSAYFHSFLTYNTTWHSLSELERAKFRNRLLFQRTEASEPGINGYLSPDRTYSSGGRALDRATVRSY